MTHQNDIRGVGEGAVRRRWSAHIDDHFRRGQRAAGRIGKGATDQHGGATNTVIAALAGRNGGAQKAGKHRGAPLDLDH